MTAGIFERRKNLMFRRLTNIPTALSFVLSRPCFKGRCRDACSAGRDAAPAGVEGTSLCVIGRPWVSVRAHYGALPLTWLDGDRQRREIVVSQVPRRTDRGLKKRRGGTAKGVAVCLCFLAIQEISRGRYQRCAFRRPVSLPLRRRETP